MFSLSTTASVYAASFASSYSPCGFFQKRARCLHAAIYPIITGCQVTEIPLINFAAAQNDAACTQLVYSARHPWLALETVSTACYKAAAQRITSAFVFFYC